MTTKHLIKKSIIAMLLVCATITNEVNAQKGSSYFNKGKCELGFTVGLNMGAAFLGSDSEWDMRIPFLPILGFDAGLNFSYSLTDWMKIALPVGYSINACVFDDEEHYPDVNPFGFTGFAKIPVIVAFKVLKGHIGVGFQQNIVLHKASKFEYVDLNASCIVLDFGLWSPWVFVGSAGHINFYQRTDEGAVGYLRLGFSLNKIGTADRKSNYFFLSYEGRFNFLDKSSGSKKARRRR